MEAAHGARYLCFTGPPVPLEKVAAPGDPSPIGGTFDSVSPGVISNTGQVFFLALPTPGSFNSDLFMWENGVVTKVAATGDPAPGGGTYSIIGSQSVGYVDGTTMPIGPLPDINDSGDIAFRAIVSGGITDRGIIVRRNGVDQWYVKVPDPTPIGGTYLSMEAPSINNAGQVSFFADYNPTPTTTNSGWFAGAPGHWRKVIVFGDSVDGGQVFGLAFRTILNTRSTTPAMFTFGRIWTATGLRTVSSLV